MLLQQFVLGTTLQPYSAPSLQALVQGRRMHPCSLALLAPKQFQHLFKVIHEMINIITYLTKKKMILQIQNKVYLLEPHIYIRILVCYPCMAWIWYCKTKLDCQFTSWIFETKQSKPNPTHIATFSKNLTKTQIELSKLSLQHQLPLIVSYDLRKLSTLLPCSSLQVEKRHPVSTTTL